MNSIIRRQTLGDLLRRTAARVPHKPAILCGNVAWTYSELDAVCDRLAGGLAGEGVRLGERVGVLSRNSHAFAVLRFALARLGAIFVPINFMLKAEEAAYILKHAGVKVLCVDSEFAELGRAAAIGTRVERFVHLPSEEPAPVPNGMRTFDELISAGLNAPEVEIDGRTPVQIIYTSGTESLPKGALLTHEAVIWEYVSCVVDIEIATGDRVLHSMPLYHCGQLEAFLGPCVYVGATNVITSRATPERLFGLIQKHRITSFFAPPTVWISLLRSPLLESGDLSSLKKGYYGAAIMPVEVLRELQSMLPDVRLWNLYGQTEITGVATVLKPEDQLRKAGSVGQPVLNVETRVIDAEGRDVKVGEIGEIVHRSPQLIREYFNDDLRTDQAFTGGWFHSGDLATVDEEGFITVIDRKKDMIKSGGENVASREVEETVYRLAGVSEVAVVGVPHPHWIEAILAVVVCKAGHTLSEQMVIEHCRQHMAHFKAPKRVVITDSLPKNPSGKLLKRELRQRYARLMMD